LITEDAESWKITSLAATSGSFPTIVAETAPKAYNVVDMIKQNNQALRYRKKIKYS